MCPTYTIISDSVLQWHFYVPCTSRAKTPGTPSCRVLLCRSSGLHDITLHCVTYPYGARFTPRFRARGFLMFIGHQKRFLFSSTLTYNSQQNSEGISRGFSVEWAREKTLWNPRLPSAPSPPPASCKKQQKYCKCIICRVACST